MTAEAAARSGYQSNLAVEAEIRHQCPQFVVMQTTAR